MKNIIIIHVIYGNTIELKQKQKKKKKIKAWERERERIGQKKIMIPAEMFKLLLSNTLNLN